MSKIFENKEICKERAFQLHPTTKKPLSKTEIRKAVKHVKALHDAEELISTELKQPAKRFNTGKVKYSGIQWNALIELAKVSSAGAEKYGNFNYKKGFPITELVNSALRHLIGDTTHKGFLTGEDYDEECKTHHLANAAWNLLTALEQQLDQKHYSKFDDRYKVDKK